MAVMDDLKTFKNSAWLGWQMEANWTDPFLFATYSIVKPIAGTLILVFMYLVITSGETETAFFSYMYVGNAFYMFVAEVLFGVTWVIHDDREHFMTLKQVYIAPIKFYVYVFGRAAIKIAIVSIGVLVTLAFGVFVLGVQVGAGGVDIPLFVLSLLLGLSMLLVMGLAMGGLTFLTAKHEGGINEGVAGVFYVLSGVIFPITVLPHWVQGVSMALPVTYWMEAIRRGLMPDAMAEIARGTGLEHLTNLELMGALLLSAAAFLLLSVSVFKYADRVARRKGRIDWTSAY